MSWNPCIGRHGALDDTVKPAEVGDVIVWFSMEALTYDHLKHQAWSDILGEIERRLAAKPMVIEVITPGGANPYWTIAVCFNGLPHLSSVEAWRVWFEGVITRPQKVQHYTTRK